MLTILLIALFVLSFLGIPIAFSLLASCLICFLVAGDIPLETLPQRLVVGLDSYPLLAIPLFILAGTLMNGGGITIRLVRLAGTLVGHIRGNLAHVGIVSNMFMSGISGSGVADAAATGSTLIPSMVKKGYGRGFSSAVMGAAATVGPIIPPSIPMIIYGSIAGVSIGGLFLGGAIPGVLMSLGLMVVVYFIARKRNLEKNPRATFPEIYKALKESFWALIMPLVIIGGIFTGIFTATESAVIAVIYSFIIGMFVYKDLKWQHLPEKLLETLMMTATIGIIISASSPFGWIMAFEQGPQKILEMFQSLSLEPWIILLLLTVFNFVLGTFLEGAAHIIITTPIVMPLLASIGVDPVHYGILLAINVSIGAITPPVGTIMFVTNSIAQTTTAQFMKESKLFFVVLIFLTFVFTYVPQIVMFLPNVLMK